MRVRKLSLSGIERTKLFLGYVGENEHTQIRFDASCIYTDNPGAWAGLTMQNPAGTVFPIVLDADGNEIIWNVSASDVAIAGNGSYQLTFTDNDEIIKTFIGQLFVLKSLTSAGDIPTPIENWIDQANQKLAEVEAATESIDNMDASATKLSPDASPTVTVSDVDGHKHLAFGIPQGEKGDKGEKGDTYEVTPENIEEISSRVVQSATIAQYTEGMADQVEAAQQHAKDAGESATAADTSKKAAAQSAQAASQSATAADTSARNAAQSATNAGNSAQAADRSAQAASQSATNAAQSERNAADSAQDAQDVLDSIPADYSTLSTDVTNLKSAVSANGDTFYAFAYGLKYLTQFTTGTYKWYPMTLANGTQIALKTLDGTTYNNGELLLYDGYAGTQLGTIYPTISGDTAYFTVDKDNVTYVRTGANFSHGATNVYLVVSGLNAAQKIDKLEAQANASTSDIRHIFGFEFGDINSAGAFVASQRRMATPNIQHYEYDIIIQKRNGYTACGLCIYADASGTNPQPIGLINTQYDYLLRKGTYFRLYIYNPDNTQTVTGKTYDNLIYNDFHAYNRDASEQFVHSGDYKDNYLYNRNVHSVCHRGASRTAPENTLPAFIEARRWGFDCVETDLAWTSDSVPVLLHDTTIDRTSNGTGNISSLTYDQIKNLDFGSWFSPDYAGTKIPTLEEFLQLCRKIGLRARIDLSHSSTGTQLEDALKAVVRNGMKDNAEFIGYNVATLERVKAVIPTATLIYLVNTVDSQAVAAASGLKTAQNEVHLLTQTINNTVVGLCADALIPLEYWTAGTLSAILNLDPYVTTVTVEDSSGGYPLVAGSVLYQSVIS